MTDRIDRAIDAAADAMTAGLPGSDLRARIVARIEAGDGRRRVRPLWLVPIAAAAIAVFALAIVLPRHQRAASGPRADSAAIDIALAAPSVRIAPAGGDRTASAVPGAVARRPPSEGRREKTMPPSAVAALAPPTLAVDRLAIAPIGRAAPIQVPEMTIPSIDVAPLDLDERPETRRQ
jgi:hypothetical protein